MNMAPIAQYLLYCDHGFPVGGDCWRCWQRRALDAEAAFAALTAERDEALKEWLALTLLLDELREELAQARNALANVH